MSSPETMGTTTNRSHHTGQPRSYDFTAYDGLKENPDFHRRSLRFNLVLRWEYAPGSTIFVVWQNRDCDLTVPMAVSSLRRRYWPRPDTC